MQRCGLASALTLVTDSAAAQGRAAENVGLRAAWHSGCGGAGGGGACPPEDRYESSEVASCRGWSKPGCILDSTPFEAHTGFSV